MKRIILLSLFATISLGTATYAGLKHPGMVKELIIKIDTLGITTLGAAEQKRVAEIRTLPIPYEKRAVLIDRTIFMGADARMVYLAIGAPRSRAAITKTSVGGTPTNAEQWYYHFDEDKRPTILEFEDGILTSARKVSVVEMAASGQ